MRQLKHLSLLLGLLLLGPSTYAQSVRFQSQAISSRGAGIANATVAVCSQPANTNTQPCSPLATLATSTSTTSGGANPLTADSFGNFFFYAAPGRYTVQIYGPAVSGQFVIPDVALSCDPAGPCTTPGVPFTISGTGTVNTPTFEVAQTGAINGAGTLNGVTEGCALPANAVWNIMLNLNQCSAAGAAVTSLPLYVQANPSGNQAGNAAGANWSVFDTIKCASFTGNPAFLNCQGHEAEAQYTGTLAAPNNLTLKGNGGQVYIDNTTTATTAAVPVGISQWAGAPFYAYGACGASCGTGSFVYAISLSAEQPTASDSKGNAVGTGNRAALRCVTNFANDPCVFNWDKTGTTTWQLLATANASAQPFDMQLQSQTVNTFTGFRFQNTANGNAYIRSSGSGAVILNGNPTFAGEGPTTNGTGGLQVFPGGGSGALCNMSTTGIVNFCSNSTIRQRNSGNTLDERIIGTDAFDDIFVGDGNVSVIVLNGPGGIRLQNPIESTGVVPTLTGTGACSTTSAVTGGSFSGSASCTAATAASTLTITFTPAAAHGYICNVQDETTRANLFQQTSHTTTTCVLTATSVTQNDVFVFTGIGF